MSFDLATDQMYALDIAIVNALNDTGVDEVHIEQNITDAVVVFLPNPHVMSGTPTLAIHALLAEKDVAVVSTDKDVMGMIRIVFGRAADGTITPAIVKTTHDAILDDWFLCCGKNTNIIMGNVRDDRKNRWPDGTLIHTSALQTGTVVAEGAIVNTLRTAYLLGRKKQDSEVTDREKIGSVLLGHPAIALQVRN